MVKRISASYLPLVLSLAVTHMHVPVSESATNVTYYKATQKLPYNGDPLFTYVGDARVEAENFCLADSANLCTINDLCPGPNGLYTQFIFGEPACGFSAFNVTAPDVASIILADIAGVPCDAGVDFFYQVFTDICAPVICQPDPLFPGEEIFACCKDDPGSTVKTWIIDYVDDTAQAQAMCSGGGDPHYSTWVGKHYNYHGECDLVLVHAQSFQGGQGLNVHVRTKIESVYSIITAIAIQVGAWKFEFNHETVGYPMYYVNQMELPALPYEEGQFKVSKRDVYNEDFNKLVLLITMSIGTDATLHISVMDQWVHVSISAASQEIMDSKGLSGSYPKGEMLGRDGTDLSHDRNAFGSDWQVQQDEPKLFRSTPEGHPEAPASVCKLPDVDAHQYLRTRNMELYQMATAACKKEGMSGLDLEDCIFDVSVMNNPKIAAAWWAAEKEE